MSLTLPWLRLIPAKVAKLYAVADLHDDGESWSSLVDEDESCIGPSDNLLCLLQAPKNYGTHAWQHFIHV